MAVRPKAAASVFVKPVTALYATSGVPSGALA